MIGVLVRKLTGLGRDENGAALMVTLALFLFMYLSGAGVFAIGKVVKDRVHLQNACDAAAYSAAVVQADTLSRIATINRAMAWTYVSMTRRQMDYIVYKWLNKTLEKYVDSKDPKTLITLNDRLVVSEKQIRDELKRFYDPKSIYDHLDGESESFYSKPGDICGQIEDDRANIMAMNIWVSDLKEKMRKRITDAVKMVLDKNVESYGTYFYFLKCSADGIGILKEENRFTSFVDETLESYKWFEPNGIFRDYDQKINCLVSRWNGSDGPRECRGEEVKDYCFTGQRAEPMILKESYFGKAGTITVGLAKYNENPWYRILKTKADTAGILKGIFAAFNPYKHMEWTWTLSSAKAGYKYKGDENKEGEKRRYRIDWRGNKQDWNLRQSDWDAVFVPVRRAVSQAKDGEWIDSNVPELGKWITDEDGWKKLSGSSTVSYKVGDMPALPGMDWNEDGDTDWSIAGDDERGRYSGLNWHQEAALIRDSDGAGGNMLWNRLAEMLYH